MSQMLAPGRLPGLFQEPRIIAAAVANATTALTKGLSAENQKFVFMLIISSIRRPAFQKGLKFFLHLILPRLVREQDHAGMKFWNWQKENLPSIGHSIRTAVAATLAIIVLIPRSNPAWIIALHRFIEVSVGIIVALIVIGLWPERSPNAAQSAD